MAVQMSVQLLGADVAKAYLEAAEKRIPAGMVRGILGASIALQKELRLHVSGKTLGGPKGAGANPFAGPARLGRGNFARSWQIGRPAVTGNSVTGSVGSNHPGAMIHETGGTIRPKNAKSLAIPIAPEADRRRPRDFPADKTSVIKTARGAFIVLNEDRRTVFLYVLKRSVQMPARRYVTRAITDAQPTMDKFIEGGIDAALKAAE